MISLQSKNCKFLVKFQVKGMGGTFSEIALREGPQKKCPSFNCTLLFMNNDNFLVLCDWGTQISV